MDRIPATFCIDSEPDPRLVREPEPWVGFRTTAWLASMIRDRLAASSGLDAHLAWLFRMDLGIEEVYGSMAWGLEAHEREVSELLAAGDEIGVHPHGWRHDAAGWFIEAADHSWLAACTDAALSSYRETFGRACPSHRFGEGMLVPAVLRTLREHDVAVDLTVEPGYPERPTPPEHGERLAGLLPSSENTPDVPYWAGDDPHTPSATPRTPLMVPITSGIEVAAHFVDGRVLPVGKPEKVSLWTDPRRFASMLDDALDRRPGHIAFAIRTDLALRPAWEHALANLDTICAHPLAPSLEWVTPAVAAERLASVAAAAADARPAWHSARGHRWSGGVDDVGARGGADLAAIDALIEEATRLVGREQELERALEAANASASERSSRRSRWRSLSGVKRSISRRPGEGSGT